MACTDFTNDFYKLVNIRSNSSRSLFSYLEGQTDDEDDEEDEDDDGEDSSMSESQVKARNSPTPSEAGRAQLTSCSSSETDEHSITHAPQEQQQVVLTEQAVQQQEQEDEEEEEEHDYAVIEECREMALAHQPVLNEQQCIAQIIKTELRRPPHVLVKSKSVLEDQEPSCILRHNQRRELESSVVRSDSISCALMAKMAKDSSMSTQHPPLPAVVSKLKERLLQRHEATTATANSWRRSNGWKRVTSPVQPSALVSPTKKVSENAENIEKNFINFMPPLFAAGNKINVGVAKELPQGTAHTNSNLHTHLLLLVDLIHILFALIAVAANDATEASSAAAAAAAAT